MNRRQTDTGPVSIIGTGRLGRCLALAMREHGVEVYSLFNRTETVAADLARQLGSPVCGAFPQNIGEIAPLTFICVSDDIISRTAGRLASLSDDLQGYAFVHCSGGRSSGELRTLALHGARTASFHPVQTFPQKPSPAAFRRIWVSLEGEAGLLEVLELLAHLLGARTVRVSAGQKRYLHIAAVLACNYVASLAAAAEKLLPAAENESQRLEVLEPLMRQTLERILSEGPVAALGGPLQRGDIRTLEKHLQALETNPELRDLYVGLGRYTASLLQEAPSQPDNLDKVLKLFGSE